MAKELQIENERLILQVENQKATVKWKDKIYENLYTFCKDFSNLSDPKSFALISNFFWKGFAFEFIDDIPLFQQAYLNQVEKEKKFPGDIFPFRLTDYQIFDVSVMHKPKVMEGNIHFFVCQIETGLPYKVVAPFPYPTDSSTKVHYQILPIYTKRNN